MFYKMLESVPTSSYNAETDEHLYAEMKIYVAKCHLPNFESLFSCCLSVFRFDSLCKKKQQLFLVSYTHIRSHQIARNTASLRNFVLICKM